MYTFVLAALVAASSLSPGPGGPAPAARSLPEPHAVRGVVRDTAGRPLAAATVRLLELGRTTTTTAEGRFGFAAVNPGAYRLSVALIGYAPVVRPVVVGEQDVSVEVALRPVVVELEEVQVTSTPVATTLMNSPQPVSAVAGAELARAQAPSLGETIQGLPGVRSQSTGTGIGKPVIRGLGANRVLVVADGQRLESQQWGDEHGASVETADAERIEVIRGPASVLYGSDALGGVVNVVAKPLPDALDRAPFVAGRLATAYSTNNRQPDATAALEGARGGVGFRLSATGRTSDDVRTPAGPLVNSGNRALAGSGAVGLRGAWGSASLTYAHRDERVEIHEDPAANPGATPFQRIGEDRAKAALTLPLGATRLELDAGYERNRRREFEAAEATDVALGLLSQTYTSEAHLHHALVGPWAGVVGVSALHTRFDKFGEETLIPNTSVWSGGIYGFEQAELGRWHLSAGLRFDHRRLAADADAALGLAAQRRTWSAVTGNVGVLYHLSEPLAVVLNVGRGFRAPSAFDLFAHGVHEGTVTFERGNPALATEHSLNTDLALRLQGARVRAEVGAFANLIRNYIYSAPTGTVDSASGFQIYDVTQGDARLLGFEAALEYHPTAFLHLHGTADYTHGQNTSTGTPLPAMPPFRASYGVRLEGERLLGLAEPYVSLDGETNARQPRLDPSEAAYYALTGYASRAYTLATLGAGFALPVGDRAVQVDLTLRNAFDARYASFLSRYKTYALDPGRNLIVRVSTAF
ncbi:MAG TPA: TonB-dependent receptor [Gemmatimonadales bacterium]|nr:TonB-dependent receptor [Gemmatimonadales bacterium]